MGLRLSKRESKALSILGHGYLLGLPVLAYYTYGKKRADPLPPFGLIGYLLVLGVALTFTLAIFADKIMKGEAIEGAFTVDPDGTTSPAYASHRLIDFLYDYWYIFSIAGAVFVYGVSRLIFGGDHKRIYQVLSYIGNLVIYLAAYLPLLLFVGMPVVVSLVPSENKKR